MESKNLLPFAMRTACLRLQRCGDQHLVEHGIPNEQFIFLATLARGKALTQRELAARMPSDRSTVREMLVLLESRGPNSQQNHSTDRRAITVSLTSPGAKTFRRPWKSSPSIREAMMQRHTVNETRVLISVLQRVSDSLVDEAPTMANATAGMKT